MMHFSLFSEKLIKIRRIYPLVVLLFFSFWPLYLSVFLNMSTATFNTITHFLPLRYNAIHTMFAGHLPLWNPYILSGMPLVGDAVSNPFDPLNILFIFLNPVNAYEVMISLQLFLAGLFMFLYLRKSLNLNSLSALLGGVLYILNPMLIFVQRLDFINSLGSFMWLPVIVLFLERAMESKSYRSRSYAILMGMALSFSFFLKDCFFQPASQKFFYFFFEAPDVLPEQSFLLPCGVFYHEKYTNQTFKLFGERVLIRFFKEGNCKIFVGLHTFNLNKA